MTQDDQTQPRTPGELVLHLGNPGLGLCLIVGGNNGTMAVCRAQVARDGTVLSVGLPEYPQRPGA